MATATANIVVKPIKVVYESASARKSAKSSSAEPEPEPNASTSISDYEIYGRPAAFDLPDSPQGKSEQSTRGSIATAVIGSASGVGGFFHSFSKGMLLDLPLAITDGLRNAPQLYGGEVYERDDIVDWKSGGVVAAKTFRHGVVDGFRSLIQEPARGAKQDGTIGAIKGVGVGILNLGAKVGSGSLGIVSYTGDGVYQSIRAAAGKGTTKQIERACWQENPRALYSAIGDGTFDNQSVLAAFERHRAGSIYPAGRSST